MERRHKWEPGERVLAVCTGTWHYGVGDDPRSRPRGIFARLGAEPRGKFRDAVQPV